MTLQTLYDQLLELRIPAFRQALAEQQANPQFTELAFEERLALLVDHECTQRRENRIRRNLQAAAFSLSASLEELDLSPARGLERRTILELGQCNWIPARQNIIILGPTGSGKSYLTSAFGKAAVRNGFTVRYHRTARLLHTLSQVRSDGSLTATLIATQVPINEWYRRIPDPTLADAILDRLVHNAHRLELKGESQRKIRAKRTMSNT